MQLGSKKYQITFLPSGAVIDIPEGGTVMEAAQKAGVYLGSVCSGKGHCGKCRIIVREGRASMQNTTHLSGSEVAEGYVLACLTEVLSDLIVEVPAATALDRVSLNETSYASSQGPGGEEYGYQFNPVCRKEYLELPVPNLTDNASDTERIENYLRSKGINGVIADLELIKKIPGILRRKGFKTTATTTHFGMTPLVTNVESGDKSASNYGLAVDVGTTTVAASLMDLADGKIVENATDYNSQIIFGADVITRILYTQENENGIETLQKAVIEDINKLGGLLAKRAGISIEDINCAVCAGNTTMMHMLLGISAASIRKEPYIPVASKPPAVRSSAIGINIAPNGMVECLPSVGAYVGSDITAGVLASGMAADDRLSMLIDIGTNGEIVLGNRDLLICCSASAGPAFEGAGTSCGMRAARGAIETVRISPDGDVYLGVIGGKVEPTGICGSGLISLIAELFTAGIIDRSGRFHKTEANKNRFRSHYDENEFIIHKAEKETGRDCFITEDDIASYIRTKGAIYTAAESLLWQVGFNWDNIETIYISGAFGNHIDIRRSIVTGLLPDIAEGKFKFIGNGSLTGTKMCLYSQSALEEVRAIADRMTYFDLSTDLKFMNEYTASLFLPHTDVEKFRSVVTRKDTGV